MERLERVLDKLPPIFAVLGIVGLFTAAGLNQAGGDAQRYAIPVLVASLALLLYYVIERPDVFVRSVTGRSAKYGGNALAMSLVFIVILALVNVLAARFTYRLDMTQEKEFTLSPQTVKILSELNQPVKITSFTSEGMGKESLQDTIKQFATYTDKLSVEYVDPDMQPGLARQMGVEFSGTTVVQSGDNKQTTMGTGEGDLISAILKVTRGEPRKVYFIVGHGEPDPEGFDQNGFSGLKQALEAENYKVESLSLITSGKIPDDASVVVVAGPTKPMLPQETQAITDYLDKGGKALLLADPTRMALLPELADRYGIEIGKGVILETAQSLSGDPRVPVIAGRGYQYSPITKNMTQMATVFPLSTMVRPKNADNTAAVSKYTVTPLAQTTPQSWLATDLNNLKPQMDPAKDVAGPLSIAVSAISTGEGDEVSTDGQKKTTRLVVIGNVVFATNGWVNVEGNRDFLLNSVNYLTEEEDLISVRAKAPADRRLILTGGQMALTLYGTVIVLPLAVLGVGAYIWWSRR